MIKTATCARVMLIAAGWSVLEAQVWKDKRIAEWTVEEARQVLTDSPWVKTVTPTPDGTGRAGQPRVGMGPGGIGIGGIGIGLPGMGRHGGMGRGSGESPNEDPGQMPTLTLRWISALPVSSAEVIVHEMNAPSADEDHYGIAVYGLPNGILRGDPNVLGAELKNHAALKREGKKDIKASSAEVILRDDGPVIVYLFPRGSEISRKDRKVSMEGEIGRLRFVQDFIPDEMVYQGKLEL